MLIGESKSYRRSGLKVNGNLPREKWVDMIQTYVNKVVMLHRWTFLALNFHGLVTLPADAARASHSKFGPVGPTDFEITAVTRVGTSALITDHQ